MGDLLVKRSLIFQGEEGNFRIPVLTFVIRSRDLTILFDTGFDSRKKYQHPPMDQLFQSESNYLSNQLRALGIQTKEIDAVVLSHLHYDHAGFLSEFRGTGVPILVQKEELTHAFYGSWGERQRHSFRREDFDYQDLEYILIEGDYKVANGIEILKLPGHTIGIQGLLVDTPSGGSVLFTSDCLYTFENFGPPKKFPGIMLNQDQWASSAERIRLISKGGTEIYPGHDPAFYAKKQFAPYVYR